MSRVYLLLRLVKSKDPNNLRYFAFVSCLCQSHLIKSVYSYTSIASHYQRFRHIDAFFVISDLLPGDNFEWGVVVAITTPYGGGVQEGGRRMGLCATSMTTASAV